MSAPMPVRTAPQAATGPWRACRLCRWTKNSCTIVWLLLLFIALTLVRKIDIVKYILGAGPSQNEHQIGFRQAGDLFPYQLLHESRTISPTKGIVRRTWLVLMHQDFRPPGALEDSGSKLIPYASVINHFINSPLQEARWLQRHQCLPHGCWPRLCRLWPQIRRSNENVDFIIHSASTIPSTTLHRERQNKPGWVRPFVDWPMNRWVPQGWARWTSWSMMSYGQTDGIQVPSQKVSWLLYAWSHYRFPRFRSRVFFKVGCWKKKKQGATSSWSIEPRCQPPTMALVVLFLKWDIFPIVVPNLPSWMSQSSASQSVGGGKIKKKFQYGTWMNRILKTPWR